MGGLCPNERARPGVVEVDEGSDGFFEFPGAAEDPPAQLLLGEGAEKSRCGWLKDKYGLSWQIIPSVLGQLLGDRDRVKAGRVMEAMLKMDKIDIKALRHAYERQ